MLTYTVDVICTSIIGGTPGVLKGSDLSPDSCDQSHPFSPLNRSTGSPDDSVRCESSPETSPFTSTMIVNLDNKSADVSKISSSTNPTHSYIALISMAILSSEDNKMVLDEIYQFIMDTFPFYKSKDRTWKNNIRHNLTINECFIKNGRADNVKGNFWSIHPSFVDDFGKGDLRCHRARRRTRKDRKNASMGYHTVNNFQPNPLYKPMTSSLVGYQSMTLTSSRHNSMTSLNFAHQPMMSPAVVNFPLLSFSPRYQATPFVNHGYHPYQRPVNSKKELHRPQFHRPDCNTSPTMDYPLPAQRSTVERVTLTNTNGETNSNMPFN